MSAYNAGNVYNWARCDLGSLLAKDVPTSFHAKKAVQCKPVIRQPDAKKTLPKESAKALFQLPDRLPAGHQRLLNSKRVCLGRKQERSAEKGARI